ncbi:MAG TPA: hypothetical protein VD815_09135 [Candidatus Saccharimonadales bacterium]|nr:hypothetical protein [Candidatus Saccharimonadales bacterium]
MSLSTNEQASRSLAIKIISQDTELMAKMYRKSIQASEIYLIFRQRLALYDKASRMPLTEIDRLLLESKKTEIGIELKMFRFKQNIEEELSQVSSRLEELEGQLATLKK